MNLSQIYLYSILHYDPEAGIFTWKYRKDLNPLRADSWNTKYAGTKAGNITKAGYVRLTINTAEYSGHRLAWFYMKGEWPEFQIDHRDHVKSNNKWANLRQATQSQNSSNVTTYNSCGLKGVYWHNQAKKWYVQITLDGKRKHLGMFEDIEVAYEHYCQKVFESGNEYLQSAIT